MSKLSQQSKDLLRLFQRSEGDADGWSVVSDHVYLAIKKPARDIPELLELEETRNGVRARITPEGQTILKWL